MPTMALTCEHCGVPFRARQRADKPRRYCSRPCRDAAQTTRVTLACRQCGGSFERKAYQQDRSQERGPFCSIRCHAEWQRLHVRAEASPSWRPPARESQVWAANRLVVLERDGRRCVRCGSTHYLHVHHREHWNPDDPATHEPDNLETLCAGCHRREHPLEHGPDGRFLPRARPEARPA